MFPLYHTTPRFYLYVSVACETFYPGQNPTWHSLTWQYAAEMTELCLWLHMLILRIFQSYIFYSILIIYRNWWYFVYIDVWYNDNACSHVTLSCSQRCHYNQFPLYASPISICMRLLIICLYVDHTYMTWLLMRFIVLVGTCSLAPGIDTTTRRDLTGVPCIP